MKIKLISCEALYREFCFVTAQSPHVFDVSFLSIGLHDTPAELRKTIQKEIDDSENKGYEYIVLGYGLCSRGTAELQARTIPIIIPRAHDCVTLFMGSREAYSREFSSHPGTYYYSPGWIERKEAEVQQGLIDEKHTQRLKERYDEYVEKYGEDNAQFLIEQETHWLDHYNRAVFIDMGLGDVQTYRKFVQQLACDHNWEYAEFPGDMSIIKRLAAADWNSIDFLRVEPGQKIADSYDEQIIRAE